MITAQAAARGLAARQSVEALRRWLAVTALQAAVTPPCLGASCVVPHLDGMLHHGV